MIQEYDLTITLYGKKSTSKSSKTKIITEAAGFDPLYSYGGGFCTVSIEKTIERAITMD